MSESHRPIWERIAEHGERLPQEMIDALPTRAEGMLGDIVVRLCAKLDRADKMFISIQFRPETRAYTREEIKKYLESKL